MNNMNMRLPQKKNFVFMAIIFCTIASVAHAAATSAFVTHHPRPNVLINDYAQKLSPETVSALETYVDGLAENNGPQIAVAIVPTLEDLDIDTARNELFAAWGIGVKGVDNGVLVLVAVAERKIGIETGYGVEGDLTDAQTAYIRETYMTPRLHTGDYDAGVSEAVHVIGDAVTKQAVVPKQKASTLYVSKNIFTWLFFVYIILSVVMRIAASLFAGSESWWLGGVLGGGCGFVIAGISFLTLHALFIPILIFIGAIVIGLVLDFIMSRTRFHTIILNSRAHGGWWSGKSSGGSGGFGGFGGGGSGGGGSSGGF